MANFISEDDIEQALVQRLQHLCGYDALNCFTATPDDLNDGSGRPDKRQVMLAGRLRAAVQRLNPQAPAAAHEQAVAALLQPRTAMSLVAANREVDALIRGGVPVEYEATTGAQAGRRVTERLRVIDFDTPTPQAFYHSSAGVGASGGLVLDGHATADQGVHLTVGRHQAHGCARMRQRGNGLFVCGGRRLRVQPLHGGAQPAGQDHLAFVTAARAIVQVIGCGSEAVQCVVATQVLQPLQQGLFDLVF